MKTKIFKIGCLSLIVISTILAGFTACSNPSSPAVEDELFFTVTFSTEGGSPVPDPILVPAGSKIEFPESVKRTRYNLTGWYKDWEYKEIWDFDNDVVTGDITLYALWRPSGGGGGGGGGRGGAGGGDAIVLANEIIYKETTPWGVVEFIFTMEDAPAGQTKPRTGDSYKEIVDGIVVSEGTVEVVGDTITFKPSSGGTSFTGSMAGGSLSSSSAPNGNGGKGSLSGATPSGTNSIAIITYTETTASGDVDIIFTTQNPTPGSPPPSNKPKHGDRYKVVVDGEVVSEGTVEVVGDTVTFVPDGSGSNFTGTFNGDSLGSSTVPDGNGGTVKVGEAEVGGGGINISNATSSYSQNVGGKTVKVNFSKPGSHPGDTSPPQTGDKYQVIEDGDIVSEGFIEVDAFGNITFKPYVGNGGVGGSFGPTFDGKLTGDVLEVTVPKTGGDIVVDSATPGGGDPFRAFIRSNPSNAMDPIEFINKFATMNVSSDNRPVSYREGYVGYEVTTQITNTTLIPPTATTVIGKWVPGEWKTGSMTPIYNAIPVPNITLPSATTTWKNENIMSDGHTVGYYAYQIVNNSGDKYFSAEIHLDPGYYFLESTITYPGTTVTILEGANTIDPVLLPNSGTVVFNINVGYIDGAEFTEGSGSLMFVTGVNTVLIDAPTNTQTTYMQYWYDGGRTDAVFVEDPTGDEHYRIIGPPDTFIPASSVINAEDGKHYSADGGGSTTLYVANGNYYTSVITTTPTVKTIVEDPTGSFFPSDGGGDTEEIPGFVRTHAEEEFPLAVHDTLNSTDVDVGTVTVKYDRDGSNAITYTIFYTFETFFVTLMDEIATSWSFTYNITGTVNGTPITPPPISATVPYSLSLPTPTINIPAIAVPKDPAELTVINDSINITTSFTCTLIP